MGETTTCTFTASDFDVEELVHLLYVLSLMGLDVTTQNTGEIGSHARVSVTTPKDPYVAEVARTRRAGRKRAEIDPPIGSPIKRSTTLGDFLTWLEDEGHTAAEAADALGLKSRAVYFRRLKAIRERAAQNPRMTLGELDNELWISPTH